MATLAALAACLAGLGLIQVATGYALLRRFCGRPSTPEASRRPVSVLKPLYGSEPGLEEALASLCAQDYGPLQIVFGVQDPRDPALAVTARLQLRFPKIDIAVVVDPTPHGRNRKVANLINMLPSARHDTLVIADSDIHAPPGYLTALVDALEDPGVGVATTLYTGLPANGSTAARLGATGLTHGLLPGALMARALGREDCLGATMALRRHTLERIGGLAALAHHLADDHLLGELVQRHGLRVALAGTVPATTVAEAAMSELYRHELRWARTIAKIAPIGFVLALVQYPLVWAALAVALSGCDEDMVAVFLAAWAGRALACRGIDRLLDPGRSELASPAPIWLLPLRDLLSFTVALASYFDDKVVWRGHVMRSGPLGPVLNSPILNRTGLTPRKFGTEPP